MKQNKFVEVILDNHNSYDSAQYQREFSGRMTPLRMKKLQEIAKENTWREDCGHEYDCCGCQFEQKTTISYIAGQVVITIKKYYNY